MAASRSRWRGVAVMLAGAVAFGSWTGPPVVAAAEGGSSAGLRDETVRGAIDCLMAELLRRKDARRFWEPGEYDGQFESRQKGGWTALTVLALMQAGISYQDERLRDAVEYLEKLSMQGTYAVAVRAHVWATLPNRFRANLARDVKWLADSFVEKRGGWYYEPKPPPNQVDNSNTQYGALGLWEGAKRDVIVEPRFWRMLEDRFIQNQRPDGGWNYMTEGVTTGSMTAAGLTVLFITQDLLHSDEYLDLRRQSPGAHQQAMERGLQWMDRNFSATANPGKDSHFYYYLYGVERVGLASGYKYFGASDWYRDGAAAIIERLCMVDATNGAVTIRPSIVSAKATGEGPIADLAFALMFLSRGRVPVAINKLRDPELAWNNRPRDVANLTSWIHDRTETALNWQVVDLDRPPEQWLDAPLVYLASDELLPWLKGASVDVRRLTREAGELRRRQAQGESPASETLQGLPDVQQLTRLKRYLELGGTLLAVNEGTSRRFVDSIERAGLIMFPQLEWRALPDDHWAYTILFPVQGRRPQLRGLSNGVRDLIILWPAGDLPKSLQARDERAEAARAVAGNIYLYASERNQPRPRLAEHSVSTSPAPADAVSAVTICRAMYDGNWCPEPLGVPSFAAAMNPGRRVSVSVVDHSLATVHLMQPRPALVMISGVDKHEFTTDELNAIKTYVSDGGVMLVETAGGRGQFSAMAEGAMAKLFGHEAAPLLRSVIYSGENLPGAANLSRVEYRTFAQELWGTRETTPRLRAINVDGKPRVLFSREDISHALLGQLCWGISGYAPQSARDLLGNILQYAAAIDR